MLLKKALLVWQKSPLANLLTHRKQSRKAFRNRILLAQACAYLAKSKDPSQAGGTALVLGDFSLNNGLGRAARYDTAALLGRHDSVTTFDLTLNKFTSGSQHAHYDTAYFFCQPDRLPAIASIIDTTSIAHSYRIGRFVWETPIFPRDWLFAEQVVHEVWTPSQFCAEVFRSALHVPVTVIPHYVSVPDANGINLRQRFAIPDQAFLGIAIMDLRSCPPRKNLLDHVRAWRTAFGSDETAPMIIKIRVSKRTQADLIEARLEAADCPNIRFITDEFSDAEIAALQHAGDVYISLHRSEGFGLNIQETLLLNKPVLATDWSANAEYGPNFKNYYPVPFHLLPYEDWTRSYPDRNFRWAQPNVAKAAALLRQIRAEHQKRLYS